MFKKNDYVLFVYVFFIRSYYRLFIYVYILFVNNCNNVKHSGKVEIYF